MSNQNSRVLLFEQRLPWLGGDLQTLRDTFIREKLPNDEGLPVYVAIPPLPVGGCSSKNEYLLALLDLPKETNHLRGLVLLLHGLGGSSRRHGLRRMGQKLLNLGFGVLRLNLRGADPGRHLAGGTYAAQCNSDLFPVLLKAREICNFLEEDFKSFSGSIPLFAVGISLGGTMLLNACLAKTKSVKTNRPLLDGLVCTSSPLDLGSCSTSIELPRNRFYQYWLLKRLVRQTLADPFGITEKERELLVFGKDGNSVNTIRAFDAAITAPRWAFKDVDEYYFKASPLPRISKNHLEFPQTLFLQALDDPWVPAEGAKKLAAVVDNTKSSRFKVVLTSHGGHNGFHGKNGCWGDSFVANWLTELFQ